MKKITIIATLLVSFTKMLANNADNFKVQDPMGWKMAIISMGVVFTALLVLFICFKYGYTGLAALGLAIKKSLHHKSQLEQITEKRANRNNIKVTDAQTGETIDNEELAAAIGVALFMHEDGMHDQESNILTLGDTNSAWTGAGNNQKRSPLRRF
ncbi:MAG: OadG family protein [Bacteroidales bacterium]|nr:OadG family protein [Bacteroidales bacterium]